MGQFAINLAGSNEGSVVWPQIKWANETSRFSIVVFTANGGTAHFIPLANKKDVIVITTL